MSRTRSSAGEQLLGLIFSALAALVAAGALTIAVVRQIRAAQSAQGGSHDESH